MKNNKDNRVGILLTKYLQFVLFICSVIAIKVGLYVYTFIWMIIDEQIPIQ